MVGTAVVACISDLFRLCTVAVATGCEAKVHTPSPTKVYNPTPTVVSVAEELSYDDLPSLGRPLKTDDGKEE